MPSDLSEYASQLGDPSAYFEDAEGRVVEHATGSPRYRIGPDGVMSPYLAGAHAFSLAVENPPGFAGFPAHDRSDPRYDLSRHADALGDPSAFFVHFEAERPLVVRHSTGLPGFAFDGDGLKPLA